MSIGRERKRKQERKMDSKKAERIVRIGRVRKKEGRERYIFFHLA